MPRRAKELSALEVKRLTHPGKGRNVTFAVGGVAGLVLQITPSDAKSWLLRYTIASSKADDGRIKQVRRELGLGPYPDVTLSSARDRAREARDKIYRGIDPYIERKAVKDAVKASKVKRMTFAQAVKKFFEDKKGEINDTTKHGAQWKMTLQEYACRIIGDRPVADLTVQDIQRVLMQDTEDHRGEPLGPLWLAKTETATRLRGRIEKVLAWAAYAGQMKGDNPARWSNNLDAALPLPGKVAKSDNHPAVALEDVARWFKDLRQREGMGYRALEFLALTAARSGEVRGATWDEIDIDKKVWVIPARRMKAGREHRVPLSADAVALLEALPRFEDCNLVFPSATGKQLSDMTLSKALKRQHEADVAKGGAGYLDPRNKRPATPHGLRSSFRDWTAEKTDYPRDMSELALAHIIGTDAELSYRRGDQFEKRRGMMAAWARFLRGEDAPKVVKLEARA